MKDKPRHIHKKNLFCNKCNKNIDKLTETIINSHDDVRCIYCDNWLCGCYDAFGDLSRESISIQRIKILAKEFNG
jgi:DNA-directed RNA polymerase subunit RPC12/RpoP